MFADEKIFAKDVFAMPIIIVFGNTIVLFRLTVQRQFAVDAVGAAACTAVDALVAPAVATSEFSSVHSTSSIIVFISD